MRNGREKQGRIKSGIPKMDRKEFWREPRKWKGEKKIKEITQESPNN